MIITSTAVSGCLTCGLLKTAIAEFSNRAVRCHFELSHCAVHGRRCYCGDASQLWSRCDVSGDNYCQHVMHVFQRHQLAFRRLR